MKKILLLVFVAQFKLINAQLWQNDFSNASEWISTDLNSGTDQWVISNVAIGGAVDSINSASVGNGFAQFNSEGQCSGNHQDVVLTYFQTIDISANELSYLEFVQHYKRKKDTLYVEFSHDGLTWESIRVNQKYWFYQQTSNTDTVRVSIPSNIQSQPFYLRFKYSGECGFAWLIDDVKIFEKEQYANDIQSAILFNGLEYHKINQCIVDTVDYLFRLSNTGYDTLFDVNVELTTSTQLGILDNINFIIPFLLPNDNIDTLVSSIILDQDYSFDFYNVYGQIYSSTFDTITISDTVFLTHGETSKNSGAVEGVYNLEPQYWGMGQTFVVPTNHEHCAPISIYIPDNNGGPIIVYAMWFKKINNVWNINGASHDYTISAGHPAHWQWFSGSEMFEDGDTALVTIMTYGQALPIAYSQQTYGNDIYFIDNMYNPILVEEGHSLIFQNEPNYLNSCSCFASIDEINLGEITVYPNPTADFITLESQTQLVEFQIFSLDGKQVYTSTDFDQEKIAVSFLESGMYIIQAKDEIGNEYSGRFIVE